MTYLGDLLGNVNLLAISKNVTSAWTPNGVEQFKS